MGNEAYERALVFAAQNGNEKSFEELYRLYYQKVFALAKATLKNDADAEDVLQQTFILAWSNLSRLQDGGAFNTWIQRITLNQCYSVLRRNKPAVSIDDDENDEHGIRELESELMLPEAYAQQEDLKERLGAIINSLSGVQRQTIQLFYYDGLTVEKIAQVMDCSAGTVKSRLFLARRAIRTEIEEAERKTGSKFFGVAGIPTIAFSRLLVQQVDAAALAPQRAAAVFSKVFGAFHPAAAGAAGQVIPQSAGAAGRTIPTTGGAAGQPIPATGGAAGQAVQTAAVGTKAVGKAAGKAAAGKMMSGLVSKVIAGVAAVTMLVSGSVGAVAQKNAVPSFDLSQVPGFSSPDAPREPAPPESPDPSDPSVDVPAPAYEAYLETLEAAKDDILLYDWQLGDKTAPVLLEDICGDDSPELIFVSTVDTDGGSYRYQTTLNIYTSADGEALPVYEGNWDFAAGGGFPYYLFRLPGEKTLCSYERMSGEMNWSAGFYQFVPDESGALRHVRLCAQEHDAAGAAWYRGETPVSEAEYEAAFNEIFSKIDSILMYNAATEYELEALLAQKSCPAMTYDEAILRLRALIGKPYDVEPGTLPSSLDDFLNIFLFAYNGKTGPDEYDCENAFASGNIMSNIASNPCCVSLSLYPGKQPESHWYDGTSDPRGWSVKSGLDSYLVFDLEQVEWVARNIFNTSDEDIAAMIAEAEQNEEFYVDNGNIYIVLGGVGGPGYEIDYQRVTFDGEKYAIVYESYIDGMHDATVETYYTEVGYKNIDGTGYWSMFCHSASIPEGLSPTDEGTDDEEDFSGDTLTLDRLLSGDFTFADESEGAYGITTIDCPADIHVLDEEGEVMAWTEAGEIHYGGEPAVTVFVEEDKTYIFSPEPEETAYTVVIEGTADDTMTCFHEILYGAPTHDALSIGYTNVGMTKGKAICGALGNEMKLYTVDRYGTAVGNIAKDGSESAVMFGSNALGWLFVALAIIGGIGLIADILAIVLALKKRKNAA